MQNMRQTECTKHYKALPPIEFWPEANMECDMYKKVLINEIILLTLQNSVITDRFGWPVFGFGSVWLMLTNRTETEPKLISHDQFGLVKPQNRSKPNHSQP